MCKWGEGEKRKEQRKEEPAIFQLIPKFKDHYEGYYISNSLYEKLSERTELSNVQLELMEQQSYYFETTTFYINIVTHPNASDKLKFKIFHSHLRKYALTPEILADAKYKKFLPTFFERLFEK